jgi:hypothetical protein
LTKRERDFFQIFEKDKKDILSYVTRGFLSPLKDFVPNTQIARVLGRGPRGSSRVGQCPAKNMVKG